MPRIREIKVSYEEKEVPDPGVGEPVRTIEPVLRLTSFLRFAVDEEVWALILDAEAKLIGLYQLAKGGRHETLIDPASLYRTVLLCEGSAVILVHNHPSGRVSPSPADLQATERILLAGVALGLPLLDHVIIGGRGEYSFGRAGMLRFLEAKQLQALGIRGVPEIRNPEAQAAEARAALATLARTEAPCAVTPATEAGEGRMPVQMEQEADDDG
ncbi:MAG: JAB domain-containing protein [Candidatus Methylomirabilota bacterium]|jgi:DNA repair protein RadC